MIFAQTSATERTFGRSTTPIRVMKRFWSSLKLGVLAKLFEPAGQRRSRIEPEKLCRDRVNIGNDVPCKRLTDIFRIKRRCRCEGQI